MMRTRTRGSLDGTQQYEVTTQNGSKTITTQDLPGVKTGEYQITYDKVTPNFYSRVQRGEIINSPFSSHVKRQQHSFSGAIIEDTQAYGGAIRWYVWSHGFMIPSPWGYGVSFEQQLDEACTEAAARVESTTVDGTVEAGEARETMRLFDLNQYRLRRHIEKEMAYAKRKGYRFPGAVVGPTVMANNWLMYRYGISPFVRTLNDVLVVGSRIQTRRETSRGSASMGGNSVDYAARYNGSFGIYMVPKRTMQWEVSTRAGILYEYRNFTNRYGFSLSNVPATMWELTPYSFVVDWFANTGDFIRALTPRYHSVRLATWHGYELKVDQHYDPNWSWPGSTRYTMHKAQTGSYQISEEKRVRLPYLRTPSLYIREGALKEVVTSKRIVDAFALTTQLVFRLLSRVR